MNRSWLNGGYQPSQYKKQNADDVMNQTKEFDTKILKSGR